MQKYTILIIDDDQVFAKILQESLNMNPQFRTFIAASGTEGYSKSFNLNVDLILTDFNMPAMNGAQFVDLISSSPRFSQTPIIILSGDTVTAGKTIQESNLRKLVSKPVDIDALETIIKDFLQKKELMAVSNQDVDVRILNSFIEATSFTLKQMCGIENCQAQKPVIKKQGEVSSSDTSGLIQVESSSYNGTIVLGFPKETILKIALVLLDKKFSEVDDEVADIAGELINIIWGQAKARLKSDQIRFSASPPAVIWGLSSG